MNAHVSNGFSFEVQAPMAQAAPLFGPEGERAWAGPEWDPRFLSPQPARDAQGAVFTIQHGALTAVWVNTLFDLAAGRMQYVAFLPGQMVSVIDVRLRPKGPAVTHVAVTYTRTALEPAANAAVEAIGRNDAASGAEWEQAIVRALHHPASP